MYLEAEDGASLRNAACEAHGFAKAKRCGAKQRGLASLASPNQSEAVRNADWLCQIKSNQCNTEEVTNGLFLFINLIMILYLVILIRATVVP